MEADFDLSRLDEIPDVITKGADAASPPLSDVTPPVPRAMGESPSRATTQKRRAIALALGFFWLVVQVGVLGLRTDLARLGTAYIAAQIGLPALFSAALVTMVLWPGRDSLGASFRSLVVMSSATLATMGLIALAFPLPFAYAPPPGSMTFGQWVLVCGDIVAMMAVAPLAAMTLVLRASFPAAATARTAALGAGCGLAAVTAMHLHCENIEPLHLALGHIVPAIGITLIAAYVLRRVTRA